MRYLVSLPSLTLIALVCTAQTEAPRSRGSIPNYFVVPDENTRLNFSSPVNPVFQTPEYPQENVIKHKEGALEIEMYVTSEGKVVYSVVTVSSGDKLFDDAGLKSAMKTKFPAGYATLHGQARDFMIRVPYYFLLSTDPEGYWHTRLELSRMQQEYELAMKEFQSYSLQRTKASKERVDGARKRLEEKVAQAKRLYRVLAEKKETAILRLRDEITDTRDHLNTVADAGAEEGPEWRKSDSEHHAVILGSGLNGIQTLTALGTNELDRLVQELELKKSYL